jgi:hypothetical protein
MGKKQQLPEPAQDWLESINQSGLNLGYKKLRHILLEAPIEARKTFEFQYFTGLADGLFLAEEIK